MGWFEYFRHSTDPFHDLDSWVASKLRNLMQVRHGIGKFRASAYWPDAFLHDQGLFSLVEAHAKASREWH